MVVLDVGTQRSHRLPSDEHKLRTDEKVANQAVTKNCPVKGVKGYSVLSPYLNRQKISQWITCMQFWKV